MGRRDSIPAPLRYVLSGPGALKLGMEPVHRFAAAARLSQADSARLAVVVEELANNLYEHGGVEEGDRCEIELVCRPGELELKLTDPGRPFDPRGHDGDGDIPDRGGGAGLNLVRAWASEIDYASSGGMNRLTVHLPIRTESPHR